MSFWTQPLFENRVDAGKQLAAKLLPLRSERPIVAGMVRGGIPVAAEVARSLGAPLIPIVVQKIGAPGQPEFAMGAIVDGPTPEVIWNEDVVHAVCAGRSCLDTALAEARAKLARRREHYPATTPPIAGRTVIVVDDGIATGASVRAALAAIRRGGPKSIILAVPVILGGGRRSFDDVADMTVSLAEPATMSSVGSAYRDFGQVTHAEVQADLRNAAARAAVSEERVR